jgi:hypothetical protein
MYLEINGANQHFWQWDVNRQLIVNDAVCGEVHFCNGTTDCALVCAIYEEDGRRLVNVPNILLQSDNPLTAYLYVKGEDECLTQHRQTFKVFRRNKPADYIYTETEIKLWETLDERIKALEENPSSGGGITEESDPTVPAWAKQPNKPTYTAEEVGALPADTVIPPAGITEETDPTVQGWAKTSIPAAVGQYFKVSAVDENGNVAAVEAVDAPSGRSKVWRKLKTITIADAVAVVDITEDDDGNPFAVAEFRTAFYLPKTGVATNLFHDIKNNGTIIARLHGGDLLVADNQRYAATHVYHNGVCYQIDRIGGYSASTNGSAVDRKPAVIKEEDAQPITQITFCSGHANGKIEAGATINIWGVDA